MTERPASLTAAAVAVMETAEPVAKVRLTRSFAAMWRSGEITEIGAASPPDRPARPARPVLMAPRDMPRRRYGGTRGRTALIHALAHIELNAIDLAWDVVARFAVVAPWPRAFFDDWVGVALDEAEHFDLLEARLGELGAAYGDLPAHDGLWKAAMITADDPLARFALVPMTHEARGLDTTPATIGKLTATGDAATVAGLEIIYRDEIVHVAAGTRWFTWLCERQGRDAPATYRGLIERLNAGRPKPPFNHAAREQAGMDRAYYEGWTV